jgi:hypothetical protein
LGIIRVGCAAAKLDAAIPVTPSLTVSIKSDTW